MYELGRWVLFFISLGLFQELNRNLIIKKRADGEDASWGFGMSMLAFVVSIFPISAILTILYSLYGLHQMGCDAKLCLWMPAEFNMTRAQIREIEKLKKKLVADKMQRDIQTEKDKEEIDKHQQK